MSAPAVEKGRLARSKAGRDKGRLCVVVQVVDEDFVLTCDGRLRTFDRPKKKRKKHLQPLIPIQGEIADGRTVEQVYQALEAQHLQPVMAEYLYV